MRPPGAGPISVWMTEADSSADTTTVWRSSRTGELYVSGDFNHFTNGVGYDTPIRIGDHTVLMFIISLVALAAFVIPLFFGIVAAEDYKYRDIRLREQERRELS